MTKQTVNESRRTLLKSGVAAGAAICSMRRNINLFRRRRHPYCFCPGLVYYKTVQVLTVRKC